MVSSDTYLAKCLSIQYITHRVRFSFSLQFSHRSHMHQSAAQRCGYVGKIFLSLAIALQWYWWELAKGKKPKWTTTENVRAKTESRLHHAGTLYRRVYFHFQFVCPVYTTYTRETVWLPRLERTSERVSELNLITLFCNIISTSYNIYSLTYIGTRAPCMYTGTAYRIRGGPPSIVRCANIKLYKHSKIL